MTGTVRVNIKGGNNKGIERTGNRILAFDGGPNVFAVRIFNDTDPKVEEIYVPISEIAFVSIQGSSIKE